MIGLLCRSGVDPKTRIATTISATFAERVKDVHLRQPGLRDCRKTWRVELCETVSDDVRRQDGGVAELRPPFRTFFETGPL